MLLMFKEKNINVVCVFQTKKKKKKEKWKKTLNVCMHLGAKLDNDRECYTL